nr:FAD-dependent oxidoreductase [Rappaport israeli]
MNPTQIEHLIIGFGKAGKTLAKALANAGKSVILVEQSAKMYGGTCINIGCIPSKKLKFLAESNHPLNEAIAQKNSLIEKLNQANFDMVDKVATVITGKARFIDFHQVAVQTEEGEQIIQAEHIYINTGATNRRPDIQGIESAPNIYDSTSIMQLTEKPQQLVIIGGGYIGLEFASMFAQFGSKVTVLEVSDTFIGREDRAIANNLLEIMQRQGIEFKFSQRIQSLDEKDGQTLIHTEEGDFLADAVLISAGRSPILLDWI